MSSDSSNNQALKRLSDPASETTRLGGFVFIPHLPFVLLCTLASGWGWLWCFGVPIAGARLN